MKVIACNIGRSTTIIWQGKEEQTGIFKQPVTDSIYLETATVKNDTVSDRKHHGGEYKACYLFSAENYGHWKELYPHLSWNWGMFGENITIDGMQEKHLMIGSVYKLGDALVQITIPREPCYKLGIRFQDQGIIEKFVQHGHPGTYVKVLKQGRVEKGDKFTLIEEAENSLSISDLYTLLYARDPNKDHLNIAINSEAVPQRTRNKLYRKQKKGPE